MPFLHLGHRRQIDRRIFADRRVRAATGLHPDHPILRQDLHPHQGLGVLLRIDVVGDHPDGAMGVQRLGEGCGECRLASAHGPADPDAQGAIHCGHVLNILGCRVS